MNTRYALTFALGLCVSCTVPQVGLAGPGGLVGTPTGNGSAVNATGGAVGNGGATQSAFGNAGGGGSRSVSSAPVVSSGGAVSSRGGGNYSSPGSYTLYSSGGAEPVVRSQVRPQNSAAPNAVNRSNVPIRQAYIQPDRRPPLVAIPNNRYSIQSGAISSSLPNRYGTGASNQNLSQADLARAAADRNDSRLYGRSGVISARTGAATDRGTSNDYRGQRRRNPGFYYGNYFPIGIYSYASSYSAYPYFGGLSYGYPYSTLGSGSYYPSNYSYASGGDYSLDSVIPDDPAPVETPAESSVNQPNAVGTGTLPAQPDTLVQDVQAELARRGYFAGKIDGIVSSAFQAALRRFQTDLKLSPTGLINQASLFALGLN